MIKEQIELSFHGSTLGRLAELAALYVEVMAMQEANHERDQQGHTHAYDSNAFFEMAEKLRALKGSSDDSTPT